MGLTQRYSRSLMVALSLMLLFARPSYAQPNAERSEVQKQETLSTEQIEPKQSIVVIETNLGNMTLELFDQQSPLTVQNFLSYVDSGQYDETIFHRVIPRFMIQGGGFTPDMLEKPTTEPIKNESKNRVYNERGTIAMARTSDPHSATSQFFINLKMNRSLDFRLGNFGYAVFGKVIDGMHVVDNIALQKTGSLNGHADVPLDPVIIQRIRRVDDTAANTAAEKP